MSNKTKSILGVFLAFFVVSDLFAQTNDYFSLIQKKTDPFSDTRLSYQKDNTKISYNLYINLVSKNPLLIKKLIKEKTKLLQRMQHTAYKPYSKEEINNWLNKIVKNKSFQKAFYYLYIKQGVYQFKNKKVKLPDFQDGFKWLAKSIIETNNPIASYIGSDFIFFAFPTLNNPVTVKYSEIFSKPLYLTEKSCLGYYIYGASFLNNNSQNYQKAYKVLSTGYKKCKKLENRKDYSRIIAVNMKYDAAKAKALWLMKEGAKK